MQWHRKSAIVQALHLNRDAQPSDVANFVSAAKEDYGATGQSSLYRLKRRHDDRVYYAYLGDWLVLDNGHLSIVDNDTFMAQHEGISG